MQSVAQSWLVYRLTGSVALLCLIRFAGQFPIFLLTAFGGAIADRYNPRIILIINTSSGDGLAFLTLTGLVEIRHLFVLSVITGIVNALDIPTMQAFVANLVGREV